MKKKLKAVKGQANCQHAIVSSIYAQVLNGSLAPEHRLPPVLKLAEQFDVTVVTVQRALKKLKQNGLIVSTRGSGSYVVKDPEILNTFGIVFPGNPKDDRFSLSWQALQQVAIEKKDYHFKFYYDVDRDHSVPDFQRLVDDTDNYRIGGIIFGAHPFPLLDTHFLGQFHLPRVAMMTGSAYPDIPAFYPDIYSFCQRALDYLFGKKRQRIGIILSSNYKRSFSDYIVSEIRKRKFEIRDYWVQNVSLLEPGWAANAAEALLSYPEQDRPDVLILIDDHIVESAVSGIKAAIKRNPMDIDIVAFSNFPTEMNVDIPICRIGYNFYDILDTAIKQLENTRLGIPQDMVVSVPAVFANEI